MADLEKPRQRKVAKEYRKSDQNMLSGVPLVETWRGPFRECLHSGHAVVWEHGGGIVASWGDPELTMLPRSSSKMIQALPLVESGAADKFGLTEAHLALACASHQAAAVHFDMVNNWLSDLGLSEADLRCGPQESRDPEIRDALICQHGTPNQCHNECSGKHSGFLTLSKHLGAGAEYIDPEHPVQLAVREAFEDVTGMDSPGFGIDGCSAPNFATSLSGLARAMARYAAAGDDGSVRDRSAARLRRAMAKYPHLVAGELRSCTELMRAMDGRASIKSGADGVFVGMVPEHKMGFAVKIADGSGSAREVVATNLLIGLGVLDPAHPAAIKYAHGPILNRNMIDTGHHKAAPELAGWMF
jgi:L-asparaginase II